jgi:hypothetical protein
VSWTFGFYQSDNRDPLIKGRGRLCDVPGGPNSQTNKHCSDKAEDGVGDNKNARDVILREVASTVHGQVRTFECDARGD